MEWIPTSKRQDRTGSQRRPFPFRSRRASTIGLALSYRTRDGGVCRYSMFASVGALLSVAHSGFRLVPWADWGPACTRILPLGGILPKPAGPFWITSYAPLVVRDYDSLRARHIEKKKKSMSSNPSTHSLGPPSTQLFGEHWVGGKVKTHLPFREFVAGGLCLTPVPQVVADREWIVEISRTIETVTGVLPPSGGGPCYVSGHVSYKSTNLLCTSSGTNCSLRSEAARLFVMYARVSVNVIADVASPLGAQSVGLRTCTCNPE
ncbi:hypothetical protein EDB86DRAFT_3126923 [Lactarius hatsudake]|nr:hypothetical protein EDB86DRAFT_3126923 [Lactarius hatsudake]